MQCRSITTPVSRLALATAFAIVAGVIALGQAPASDDNWSKFRGSRAGVVDDDPALPETWSRAENVVWNFEVPGQGWSSPIVWDDLVFVTSVVSDEPRQEPGRDIIPEPGQEGAPVTSIDGVSSRAPLSTPYGWMLYAIDYETGQIRWERELRGDIRPKRKHPKNTYASETPVTDGEHVYVYHASAGLFAVDFNGNLVWSTTVTVPEEVDPEIAKTRAASGGVLDGLGGAASPTLYNGRLYISADYDSRLWFLAAFNARTGEELWHVSHPKREAAYGWSTPFVWENELRTELIAAGDLRVRSYDLTGTPLWELKGLSINTTPTPFATDELLYVSSGYPSDRFRPVYAIRPGAAGDISLKPGETSNEYVAWFQRSAAPYMPSQLVYGDYLYTLYSQGFLTAHDAKAGGEVYGRVRIARGTGGFTSSPWAYNGKIFAMSEDGDTYVIQAGPDYRLLGKNSLGEMVNATPAVLRGSLIIRTVSSLWRIGRTD